MNVWLFKRSERSPSAGLCACRQYFANRGWRKADWIMAALCGSLLLPFEVMCGLWAVFLILLACRKRLAWAIKEVPDGKILFLLTASLMIGSISYANGMGALSCLGMVVVFFMLGAYCRWITPVRFRRCLFILVCGSWLEAALACLELGWRMNQHGITLFQCLSQMPEGCRVRAAYFNPNLYATMLTFFLVCCIYLFLDTASWKRRCFFVASAALNVCMLFLTGCRAGFLPLPFFIPLFLYFHGKKRMFAGCVGLEGMGMAWLAAFPECIPRVEQMESITSRLKIWKLTAAHLMDRPLFGGGLQAYAKLSRETGGHPAPHAHNILLDSLLSGGLAGTLLLFWWTGRQIKASLAYSLQSSLPLYVPFVLSLVLIAAVFGLVDCTFNFPPTALFFLCALCTGKALLRGSAGKAC